MSIRWCKWYSTLHTIFFCHFWHSCFCADKPTVAKPVLYRSLWNYIDEFFFSTVFDSFVLSLKLQLLNHNRDNWGHIGGALGGAAMAWYFGPRLYIAELPIPDVGIQKVIVDKPIVRLPASIESIPTKISKGVGRLTRRIKIWGYIADLPDKPWRRKRQGPQIDYRRRQQTAPNRSIKPKLPPQ